MNFNNAYHRIAFYPKVTTRDSYGASVDTWPTATINTRGEIRYTGGSYGVSNEEKFFSKNIELIIRYRSGIEETMRIQTDNTSDRWGITFIEELGRKEGLRLTIEKLNL